ncbi:hypothetical protein J6590_078377 [Homalodisca vitripennis]|nr:hypothetical protein J6590_078377 [Homalodisca vitripennis]
MDFAELRHSQLIRVEKVRDKVDLRGNQRAALYSHKYVMVEFISHLKSFNYFLSNVTQQRSLNNGSLSIGAGGLNTSMEKGLVEIYRLSRCQEQWRFRIGVFQEMESDAPNTKPGAEDPSQAESSILHGRRGNDWECAEGQFKCRNGPCLNISLLCDGHIDCQGSWEDEDNCSFSCSLMSPHCDCRDVHINCTGRGLTHVPVDAEKEITWFYLGSNNLSETMNNQTFIHLDRLIYLDLSNNSIVYLLPGMFATLWQLSVLDLHNNQLTRLANGSFTGLASVKGLHLQGNKIEVLETMAFYGLTSLKTLDLSEQSIRIIEPGAFVGLRSLNGLDLSKNQIRFLEQGSLRGMPQLFFLVLDGNHIKAIEQSVFLGLPTLDKLVTDEFRFCCLARHVRLCLPPPDEFSSCEDLMSNLVLRLCVWLLAGIAIVGNILVIVWRSGYSYCNQVHSFLITNLAVGDLLMGSYLLTIALVDRHYRGVYFIYDSAWRSSSYCAMAGFLSTFSSELSVFTLTVITLDRFLVIIFPFRVRRLEMTRTKRLMLLGWLLAALLSALPLMHINYFHNFYGRSGVCLALHITPDKPNGWEYSVFVFLFLNLLSFSVIAASYLWMFVAARTTQQAVSRDRRTNEAAMAWRMSLLVATDAACWVPIIGLGLYSLAGFTVPPQESFVVYLVLETSLQELQQQQHIFRFHQEITHVLHHTSIHVHDPLNTVFAWVAVFVLPLNAAVNPVLYTLSTAPFINPARHGLLSFRNSCKLSRNTCTFSMPPTRHQGSGREQSQEKCFTISKRTSIRWQPRVEPVQEIPLSNFVT